MSVLKRTNSAEDPRAILPRYPSKQAVTLPALHIVQDALRCVPLEAIREIADLLDLSPAEVHDTMSFYGFFRDEKHPLGKTRLWVCRSLACGLRGGDELLDTVCQEAERASGRHQRRRQNHASSSPSASASAKVLPAVLIDDEARMNMTPDKVDALLEELRQ